MGILHAELGLRILLSLFLPVGLYMFFSGLGIIALLDNLVHVLGVIGDPHTVAALVGPMLFMGALGMWSWLPGMMWPCRCKTFDKFGLIIVLVAHVFLIAIPIVATYCHSETGDALEPPIIVGLLGVTHLVLWLIIQQKQKKVEPTPQKTDV